MKLNENMLHMFTHTYIHTYIYIYFYIYIIVLCFPINSSSFQMSKIKEREKWQSKSVKGYPSRLALCLWTEDLPFGRGNNNFQGFWVSYSNQ